MKRVKQIQKSVRSILGLSDVLNILESVEKLRGQRFLLRTKLGSIVYGKAKIKETEAENEIQYIMTADEKRIERFEEKDFWNLETIGISEPGLKFSDDENAWNQFNETITQLPVDYR